MIPGAHRQSSRQRHGRGYCAPPAIGSGSISGPGFTNASKNMQPTIAATSDPTRMPSFASSVMIGLSKASSVTNSDTVNPTPPTMRKSAKTPIPKSESVLSPWQQSS